MNQFQFDIVMGTIADLKRERDVLTEWQRNALAFTKRQAETIKALETERDGLQQKLVNCHSEVSRQDREISALNATIDRMREPLCRAAEQQACNERLMGELAKAPRWVPVSECVASEMDCTYQIVHGTIDGCLGDEPCIHREAYCELGAWTAGGWTLRVTHVLDNVNPPEIVPNEQCKTICVDMLNRPVEVGDVVWDALTKTFGTHLADTTTPDNAAYDHFVRVPGPGESVPHFDGWQSMCRAMQASGAAFQWINKDGKWDQPNSTGQFGFCDPVTRYRRSQGCKWKGPK
jgi:hypothetical protein